LTPHIDSHFHCFIAAGHCPLPLAIAIAIVTAAAIAAISYYSSLLSPPLGFIFIFAYSTLRHFRVAAIFHGLPHAVLRHCAAPLPLLMPLIFSPHCHAISPLAIRH